MPPALVFKRSFARWQTGSSTVSLQVSKKCTVTLAHAGRATGWALPRFLVVVLKCTDNYSDTVASTLRGRLRSLRIVIIC